MRLSTDLEITLNVALAEAGRLGHEHATIEHLLYALTIDRGTAEVLAHAGADVAHLKRRLVTYLETELERVEEGEEFEPRLALGVQRALSRAAAHAAATSWSLSTPSPTRSVSISWTNSVPHGLMS